MNVPYAQLTQGSASWVPCGTGFLIVPGTAATERWLTERLGDATPRLGPGYVVDAAAARAIDDALAKAGSFILAGGVLLERPWPGVRDWTLEDPLVLSG